MRGYAAVVSARFRTLIQYRAAAVAGIGTQLFWGLIRTMIFTAFYRTTTAPQPIRLDEVIAYVWLGQALLGLLPWSVDSELRTMIRTGNVVYELVRPLDLYNLWYARSVALRTAPTLLRSVPLFILAWLFFGLRPPPSPACALAWLAATGGALALSAAITTLITITLLWTVSGEGMARLLPTLSFVLSGMIVPLPLLPEWAKPVVYALPFRGLVDSPFRLYLGHIPPEGVGWVLLHQALWTAGIILIGRTLLGRATRRMVAQGG